MWSRSASLLLHSLTGWIPLSHPGMWAHFCRLAAPPPPPTVFFFNAQARLRLCFQMPHLVHRRLRITVGSADLMYEETQKSREVEVREADPVAQVRVRTFHEASRAHTK